MLKEFKSALLGPSNADNWFGSLRTVRARPSATSYESNLDVYSDIFRDLHNDTVPTTVKIHLITYLEENALKLAQDDCFELVYCPLLVIFKSQFITSGQASTTDPVALGRKKSSTKSSSEKLSPNNTLYFHKMATCLASLIILSHNSDTEQEQKESNSESIEKFVDILLKFSMKAVVTKLNSGGTTVIKKPDSIIVECLRQLQEQTGFVKKSNQYERALSKYSQTTLFAILEDIEVFSGDTLDRLSQAAAQLNPLFVHSLLTATSRDLLRPQYFDSMTESKFNPATLKQVVTAFSSRKELAIIHIQIVLMFKSGLQLFSGNSEEQLVVNLQETSVKTSFDVSSRLLALELLRDLSFKTIRPDLVQSRQLRPAPVDKPDTLEKKYCILCLSSVLSDDEIHSVISDLQDQMTVNTSTRAINSFYRILSFTITERPGLLERIEEIVYALAQGPKKLFSHALCLMEAQQALVARLTPRLINYLISDFDTLSATMDSNHIIKVFDWAVNRDDVHLEESKMLVLFTLISDGILAQPKNYMQYIPLFTSILWNCEITSPLKAKMNKLFEQYLNIANDHTSTMWFEFYHTALNTFTESCKIRELDACQSLYDEEEIKNLDSDRNIQKGLACPINVKRIDHTNYVSFPPTDINLELIFEISLKDDLEHNYICDKIFAICIEIYSEDKKINMTVDMPILVKGDNKSFKTMFRPISVSPFQLHFDFEFTDKDARSYRFNDSFSCHMGLQDLLFPVSAEHNHPSRINFSGLWQTVSNEQRSIETVITIPDFDDLDQFFHHFTWLNYYRITGRTGGYSYDGNIEALCVMSKERYLLMRFSITNGSVKIHILTNNYLIINHLFYELKGHTINA